MNTDFLGKICYIYHFGELNIGQICADNNPLLKIMLANGTTLQVAKHRIQLISSQSYSIEPCGESLQSFHEAVLKTIDTYDLETIWKRCLIDQQALPITDFFCFNKATTDIEQFALFLLVSNHPECFRIKQQKVIVHSHQQRDDRVAKDLLIQQESARTAILMDLIDNVLSNSQPLPEVPQQLKCDLSKMIYESFFTKSNFELLAILHKRFPNVSIKEKVCRLRSYLQETGKIEDEIIISSGIPIEFPLQVRKDVLNLKEDIAYVGYQDLTQLDTFTIDDEETLDIDDAFSLVRIEQGWIIYIHITDITAFVPINSSITIEAGRRVSSVYLPNHDINMIPDEIAYHLASLRAHQVRPTLTLKCVLSNDLELHSCEFILATIKVKSNYSYKQWDRTESGEQVNFLQQLMGILLNKQQADTVIGKNIIYQIKVANQTTIAFKIIDMNSASRSIVQDLMIYYNRKAAEFAIQHSVPILFRKSNELFSQSYRPRGNNRKFGMAGFDTTPSLHPGVGNEAYTHITAPIRRYADLINQYQIVSYLRSGKTLLTIEELKDLIPSIELTLKRQREIITACERYWFLRYLHEQHLNQPVKVRIIHYEHDRYKLELKAWHKRLLVKADNHPQSEADNCIFVFTDIDAENLYSQGYFL